jgi:hypothetical protein
MSFETTSQRVLAVGNGIVNVFTFPFLTFREQDLDVRIKDTLDVQTKLILDTDYTVAGLLTENITITLIDNGQSWLTPDGNLIEDIQILIRRIPDVIQDTDFRNAGEFFAEVHEDTFDSQAMISQALNEKLSRAVVVDPFINTPGPTIPTPQDGFALIGDADGNFVNAPFASVDQLAQDAEQSRLDAEAAQAASELSAMNSEASRVASETASQSAQDAANNSQWNDVVFVTFADSPINLTEADAGNFYSVDASAGSVVFNLPVISSLDLSIPRLFGGKKSDATTNPVVINSTGGDEIDSNGTSVLSNVQNNGFRFLPDTDLDPDSWTTIAIASASGAVNPTLIEGTGGRIVTENADMISGGLGSVAGTGVYQIQNQAGTQVFEQQLSGQHRYTENVTELRHRFGTNLITGTVNATRAINEVNMASPGEVINLTGNSNQGYDSYFVMTGGEPCIVQAESGTSIIGHPEGLRLQNIGDSYHLHQYDQNRYIVKGFNNNAIDQEFLELDFVNNPTTSTFNISNSVRYINVIGVRTDPASEDPGVFSNLSSLVLPPPSENKGKCVTIKLDENLVSQGVAGNPGALNIIGGSQTERLFSAREFITFCSNGITWKILDQKREEREVLFQLQDNFTPTSAGSRESVPSSEISIVPGNTYEVELNVSMLVGNNSGTVILVESSSQSGGSQIDLRSITGGTPNESTNDRHRSNTSFVFTATGNSLFIEFARNPNGVLLGNSDGNGNGTFLIVREVINRRIRRISGNSLA